MEYDARGFMHEVKLRLQAQQGRIHTDAALIDGFDRIRSEMDALWACVEVLAQMIDGQETVNVPDYWQQHLDRAERASTAGPVSVRNTNVDISLFKNLLG